MNRVMCKNGHFYDGDRYQTCPHCAEGVAPIAPSHFDVVHQNAVSQVNKKEKKEKKSLFKKKEAKIEVLPVQDYEKTERLADDKTERLADDKTERLVDDKTERIVESPREPLPMQKSHVTETTEQEMSYFPEPDGSIREVPLVSLQSDFAKAMKPINNMPVRDMDDMKTVGYYSTGKITEPPVGYLICTKGEDYGTGFLLKSGNNTIGRSASMDVVVMDPQVSREKQAFVMYEPHKREFYLKPGEGSGLCYFNGDVVLGPMKMKQYDRIGIGDTELMLIPVCTQEFSWEEK